MICGRCGEEGESGGTCSVCGESPLLADRYRLDAVVGRGASGVTYRATRVADGLGVCVKELLYHRMHEFKEEELFHREALVLRQLRHPAIPAYIDEFSEGTGKSYGLYVVQELVEGQDLREELKYRHYSEEDVLEIIIELCDILHYLHRLIPPVIHRDLKPGNIMRRTSDGKLMLVDFGSVKKTVAETITGHATVAGTFGFMAPEQFVGEASAASDLYALGVVALVLLSRQWPEKLIDHNHHINWKQHVNVRPQTTALLEKLVEPNSDKRIRKADEVRDLAADALRALRSPPKPVKKHKPKPKPRPRPVLAEPQRPGGPAAVGRAMRWLLPLIALISVGVYYLQKKAMWDGSRPLSCRRGELVLSDHTVHLNKGIIKAHRRCKVTLINCRFRTTQGSKGSPGATIYASGDAQVVIRGGSIEGSRLAIEATGRSTVTLENVTVEAKPPASAMSRYRAAIRLRGKARLIVTGGSIRDPESAILAERSSIAALKDVNIHGAIQKRHKAMVLTARKGQSALSLLADLGKAAREKELARKAKKRAHQAKLARYATAACAGLADCYRKHGATGWVVGRVTMRANRKGKLHRIRKKLPGASPAVVKCIDDALDKRILSGFDGPRGRVTCEWGGDAKTLTATARYK